MKQAFVSASLLIISIGLLASCNGTAPSIDQLEWRVIYRDDGQQRFEELSVFFRASDPDGPEDLERIVVIAGTTGFEWTFPREEWLKSPGGGESWWGLSSMIPVTGPRLPDVIYTVRLFDLAGRYSDVTFRPDPSRPQLDGLIWPEIALSDGVVRIKEPYNRADLILRDPNLVYVDTIPISDGMTVNFGESSWWEVWISLEDVSGGFRLGPFPVSRTETQ